MRTIITFISILVIVYSCNSNSRNEYNMLYGSIKEVKTLIYSDTDFKFGEWVFDEDENPDYFFQIFDEEGKQQSWAYYRENYKDETELVFLNKYEFDDEGQLIEEIRYDGDGKLSLRSEFQFDENGNRKYIGYDPEVNIAEDGESILEDNLVLESTVNYYRNGELISSYKHKHSYDNNKYLTGFQVFLDNDTISYSYEILEYDKKGNVLKQIKHNIGDPRNNPDIIVFEYVYYK